MGAFKPLLPFGNKTVIECCIDYLRDGGVEEIVVVLGHRADEIRWKVSGVKCALNPDPDTPMSVSIAAGVRELPEKQRQAVSLRYLADLSHKEIAEIMGTTDAAARRNVFEGLTRLRKQLDLTPAVRRPSEES